MKKLTTLGMLGAMALTGACNKQSATICYA